MSETKPKQQQPVAVAEDDTARIVYRAKGFWEKYSKPIIYGGLAVILLAGAWVCLQKTGVGTQ